MDRENIKKFFKNDLVDAVLGIIVAFLIILLLVYLITGKVYAGEFFPQVPDLYVGMDYDPKPQTYCYTTNAVGTVRLTQVIYKNKILDLQGGYQHHSCLLEQHDKNVTDSLGIGIKIPIGRYND